MLGARMSRRLSLASRWAMLVCEVWRAIGPWADGLCSCARSPEGHWPLGSTMHTIALTRLAMAHGHDATYMRGLPRGVLTPPCWRRLGPLAPAARLTPPRWRRLGPLAPAARPIKIGQASAPPLPRRATHQAWPASAPTASARVLALHVWPLWHIVETS